MTFFGTIANGVLPLNARAPLALVVAMDQRRLIGRNGDLPWRLPNDLKHFKRLTIGNTVLMGRKTWDSLGRPLPDRDNWVLTRDQNFAAEGARVFHDLTAMLNTPARGEKMIIGGAELFALTLPLATTLYLTEVDAALDGDTFFPTFDRRQWQERALEAYAADERHAFGYRFITLTRAG
ncbi:dihydrofolate reductase [Sinimarinibacterium sp. NLF-5-8]|nr:dihydrofolate reductase [Sinimarinibacterium sp. NLF-5-8]